MKNVQKSALALSFFMASAANAFAMPTFSLPEFNAKNTAIGVAVTGAAYGAYKYRSTIKNALSTTAIAFKNGACIAKDWVMNNKGKTIAAVSAVAVCAVAYKYFVASEVVSNNVDDTLAGTESSTPLTDIDGSTNDTTTIADQVISEVTNTVVPDVTDNGAGVNLDKVKDVEVPLSDVENPDLGK